MNCLFVDNIAATGACIGSLPNATVTVENSSFINNTGQMGGAIYGQSDFYLHNNAFSSPLQKYTSIDYNSSHMIDMEDKFFGLFLKCIIENSLFDNNLAYIAGGALFFQGVTVKTNKSTFRGNGAILNGGALMVTRQSTLHVHDTLFTGNGGIDGGAIKGFDHCNITVTRSMFISQFGISSTDISVQSDILLRVSETTFISIPIKSGVSLTARKQCLIIITDSRLRNLPRCSRSF